MTRIRAIAPLAVLALAAVAGCSDEDGARPAATVNGVEITQQDVVDELEAIRANESYLDQIETQVTVLGEDEGTFDTAFVAQLLGIRIRYAIIEAELADRGIEVDEACSAAADEAIAEQVGGEETFAAFDEGYRRYLGRRFAELVALQSDLAGYPCVVESDEALLEQYFEEHPDSFPTNYCVSPIQVATQAEADEIVALLDGGADYDQLAAERSETPSDSQCVPEFNMLSAAPEVAELAEGAYSRPVLLQELLFIFRLDEVQEPTFETARDQVVSAIGQEVDAAFNEWFEQAVATAEVDLDPRYGTWDAGAARINRPTAATTSTTAALPLDTEG